MKPYTWAIVAKYSISAACIVGGTAAAQSVYPVTAPTAPTAAQPQPAAAASVVNTTAANHAAAPAVAAVQRKPLQVGDATRQLLEVQASGVLASPKQYAVSADVAERIYLRYLDSFSHPIAEKTDSTLED